MPRVTDNGRTNPLVTATQEDLIAWLRRMADEAGYADRNGLAVQVKMRDIETGEVTVWNGPVEITYMVSNIPNQPRRTTMNHDDRKLSNLPAMDQAQLDDSNAADLVECPDLTGRFARCWCGNTRPSDPEKLAFFEFRGDGSRFATDLCKCGCTEAAHEKPHIARKCRHFAPRGPHEFDSFYCGCRGWD